MPAPDELQQPYPIRLGRLPGRPFPAFAPRSFRVGSPSRLSQLPVEALYSPDNAKGRLSQAPIEALYSPDNAKGRLSQLPVEALVQILNPNARLSQIVLEVLRREVHETVDIVWID